MKIRDFLLYYLYDSMPFGGREDVTGMCGFCGFTGEVINREQLLRTMADKITHRGPDSEGVYMDDTLAMAFRRLSIIDLEGGHQPIENEDGTKVLMFNGEIYNYRDLRKELIAASNIIISQGQKCTRTILTKK